MSKKGLFGLVGVAVVVTAAILVVAALAGGSNGAAPAPAPAQVGGRVQTTAPPSPAGGPVEGIKVKGRWTLEVREPDGMLVSRQEFENALTLGGRGALQAFLARTQTPGTWRIEIQGSGASHPCLSGTSPFYCIVAESSSVLSQSYVFKTLSVSAPTSGADAGKVVLSGTATVQVDSNISVVSTIVGYCAPTVAPASCADNSSFSFTGTNLASPVSVLAGQQVLVTVKLSFS